MKEYLTAIALGAAATVLGMFVWSKVKGKVTGETSATTEA